MSDQALVLADDLSLPMDTAVNRLAFIGTTGSGKSYSSMKLAEVMWDAGVQFVALDNMGIWCGLRVDGIGAGIPIMIFGGRMGDEPISERDGARVAETVHETGASAVIDISEFDSDAKRNRFAAQFADRLYALRKAKPGAIHLFLEEAHEYIPQNPQKGDTHMLHVWTRLWKQGGNFGIGGSIITQRPQDVGKKSLDLTACFFAFNTVGSLSVDAMEKQLGNAETQGLNELQPGECIVWSPSWLRYHGRHKFALKRSKHLRFDPYAESQAPVDRHSLVQVDIKSVSAKFAALSAKDAKEEKVAGQGEPCNDHDKSCSGNDRERVKALKERVKELESRAASGSPAVDEAELQLILLDLQDKARTLKEAQGIAQDLARAASDMQQFMASVNDLARRLAAVFALESFVCEKDAEELTPAKPRAPRKEKVSDPADGATSLSRPQMRILASLANFAATGVQTMSKGNLAVYSGQSPKSSGFRANLSALSSAGLIAYHAGDVALTDKGKKVTPDVPAPATLAQLHDEWARRLSRPQHNMLRALIEAYPEGIDRAVLARQTGQSFTSSGYRANLSKLSGLGLIRYHGGSVQATALLFPEGLK